MFFSTRRKLYLPALSLVALVILLLVIFSFSTYKNLDREKQLALQFLRRQGLALIRSLEASSRTGMMHLRWEGLVDALLQETARDEDIAFVYLADSDGTILHHSNPEMVGKKEAPLPLPPGEQGLYTAISPGPGGERIYVLAKKFEPLLAARPMPMHGGMMMMHRWGGAHDHLGDVIVLGLQMTAVEAARRADIQHAVLMAAAMVLLGSGAIFFVVVIQNYYLVGKTLKETQDFASLVINHMANGLITVDRRGKVLAYNQVALDLLGIDAGEIGKIDLRGRLDFASSGIDQTLCSCERILDREVSLRSSRGEIIPVAVSVTPIVGEDGDCNAAVILLRDLRQIKRLESQVQRAEKLAAIGRLAAGVAHEIRNPLSSIRGFAQFLAHALRERPQEKEYAEVMVQEVDRINRVVTELLTFARPLEPVFNPADVGALLEHTIRLTRADAERRGVRLVAVNDVGGAQPLVDGNQLTQALLNLVLNGIQFSPEGGELRLGARVSDGDSSLQLWVEDEGPGVPAAVGEKIFEPFYTTREQGTGLGLAIVHKIAENHGGRVWVESPPAGKDKGCRFTLEVPWRQEREGG